MGSVPVPMASSIVGTCFTSYAPRSATQLAKPVPARIKLSALPAQADAKPSMVTVLVSKASTIAVIPPTSIARSATQAAKPAKDLFQATVLLVKAISPPPQPSMGSVPVPMANIRTAIPTTSIARTVTQTALPAKDLLQATVLLAPEDLQSTESVLPICVH